MPDDRATPSREREPHPRVSAIILALNRPDALGVVVDRLGGTPTSPAQPIRRGRPKPT